MTEHKFKPGQTVTVFETSRNGPIRAKYGLTPHGKFQIVRTLPPERGGHNQYRIKSELDGHERVVIETEIA